VWKILISLANAVKHLHEISVYHGEIRMENVLIDGDYHMKLVEKSLLHPLNWQIEMNKENVKLIKGKGVLFSPCILKCLYHQKTQINSYDPFKADIYAIGMIMLECASLQKAEDFYDYEKFFVKQKEIQYTIYELRKRYGY
jgi:serine/threonine protein kinase